MEHIRPRPSFSERLRTHIEWSDEPQLLRVSSVHFGADDLRDLTNAGFRVLLVRNVGEFCSEAFQRVLVHKQAISQGVPYGDWGTKIAVVVPPEVLVQVPDTHAYALRAWTNNSYSVFIGDDC